MHYAGWIEPDNPVFCQRPIWTHILDACKEYVNERPVLFYRGGFHFLCKSLRSHGKLLWSTEGSRSLMMLSSNPILFLNNSYIVGLEVLRSMP